MKTSNPKPLIDAWWKTVREKVKQARNGREDYLIYKNNNSPNPK